jgi:hypothetical protein
MVLDRMNLHQVAFPIITVLDAEGQPIPVANQNLSYSASDETIGKWERRLPDGSASETGEWAVVSQGLPGMVQFHVTNTNPDGKAVDSPLVGIMFGPDATAVSVALEFHAPINKI